MDGLSQVASITHQPAAQLTEDKTTDTRQCVASLLSQITALKHDLKRSKQKYEEWEEEFGDFLSERAFLTSDATNHHRNISSTAISARNTILRLEKALVAIELRTAMMQRGENQSHHSNDTVVSGDRTPHGEVACEVPLPASSVGWDELTERQHLDLADDVSNHTLADENGQPDEATQAEPPKDSDQEEPSGQSNSTIASIVQGILPPSTESCAASADPRADDAPHGSAGRAMSIAVVPVGIAPTYFLPTGPTPLFWEGFPPEHFSGGFWLRSASPDIEQSRPDMDTIMSMVASWRDGVVPGGY
jgi:hypothetical protein